MTHRTLALSLVVCFSLLFGASSYAADQISYKPSQDVFKLEDGKATVTLDANIKEGWYTYSVKVFQDEYGIGPQATEILLQDNAKFEIVGKLRESKTIKKYDEGFEMDIEIHKKKASFSFDVKPKQDLEPGRYTFNALVYRQMCDSARCLPGEEDTVKVVVQIGDSKAVVESTNVGDVGVTTETENATDVEPADSDHSDQSIASDSQSANADKVMAVAAEDEEEEKETNVEYFFIAMAAGLVALTTPCVFPMIPITVSFFTKRAEKSKGSGLLDAGVYSGGIILTFTGLGVVIAALFGEQAVSEMSANPWVNLAIASVFILFALNLFGAIEIQIPTSILNKLNQKSMEGKGFGSILLMGLTFSLTSFACTVPFIATALGASADGEFVRPIIGMLGFSTVFAAPFFLLALFPSYLSKLPKAGGWMNNIKVVMGFLEIGFAMKFLSNTDMVWYWGILSRDLFLAIWVGCAALITMYVLGMFRFNHDSPVDSITTPRALFAILFSTITFYLVSGMYGNSIGELEAFVPPENYAELMLEGQRADEPKEVKVQKASTLNLNIYDFEIDEVDRTFRDHHGLRWYKDIRAAREIAERENKNIFIDFTGFTCTNCRWMEKNRFTIESISDKLKGMVLVQKFTDGRDKKSRANKEMQDKVFGTIELPYYVIVTPDGKTKLGNEAYQEDVSVFEAFLDKGL